MSSLPRSVTSTPRAPAGLLARPGFLPVAGMLALAGLFAAGVTPGNAQELTLAGGQARSDFTQLGAPYTVALHGRLSLDALGGVRVVAGGRFARETGESVGTTCARYWPYNTECQEEPIALDAQLVQLELGLEAGVRVGPVEFRGAVLGVQSLLIAGAEGEETGRSPEWYYPDSTHRGLALAGELVIWPVRRVGVVIRGRRQSVDFNGCMYDAVSPFCGEQAVGSWEVGLTFVPVTPRR